MIIILFIIIFISVELLLYFYGKHRDDVKCDVMIVLGAGLYGDVISSALQRRLDSALMYIQKYPHTLIVVSGGQGKDETISEALAMKRYLLAHGIDDNQIIMEDTSVSTYTNFVYSKQILPTNTQKIMVCTCDFHMYRSCRIASHLGFIPYRYPAKSTKINCIKYYVREFFCVIKNYLTNT